MFHHHFYGLTELFGKKKRKKKFQQKLNHFKFIEKIDEFMAQSIVIGAYITRYTPLKHDISLLNNYMNNLNHFLKQLKSQKKEFKNDIKTLKKLEKLNC